MPSRAMRGRWGQAAAAQAGRLLVVLDLAGQARVRGLGLDDIFRHGAPVLMAIEPHSMAWRAGQRGPARRGERGRDVSTPWPCLEHVSADGGQGLERGRKLAHAARGAQGEAAETVSSPVITLGLDVLHPHRARARILQRQWQHAERQRDTASQADAKGARDKRQGRAPRGGSGVAGRAGRKAERRCAPAGNAQEAGPQSPAALAWWAAQGRRSGRQTAPAQLDEASQQLQGACWSKGKRLLSEARTLRPWLGGVPPGPRPSQHRWCAMRERACGPCTTRYDRCRVTPACGCGHWSCSNKGCVSACVRSGSVPLGVWMHSGDTPCGPVVRWQASTVWCECIRAAIVM
jgi:hypothetical protein